MTDDEKRLPEIRRSGARAIPFTRVALPLFAVVGLVLSACAPTISVFAQPSRIVWSDGVQQHQRANLDIPPGHLPPPGMCRIWFPDRPPGQQPPPGECDELQYRIPPGAALVYG